MEGKSAGIKRTIYRKKNAAALFVGNGYFMHLHLVSVVKLKENEMGLIGLHIRGVEGGVAHFTIPFFQTAWNCLVEHVIKLAPDKLAGFAA
jgi:hypothetical protein